MQIEARRLELFTCRHLQVKVRGWDRPLLQPGHRAAGAALPAAVPSRPTEDKYNINVGFEH